MIDARGAGAPAVRLSVVIMNYNYARFLGESVRSALDQSVREIEVVVVDDGSTDNSLEVLAAIPDPRLRYVTQTNAGSVAAMNRGFAESRGPVVVFLDADDYLLEDALRVHLASFDVPDVVRSQGHMIVMREGNPSGELLPRTRAPDGAQRDIVLRFGPGVIVSTPNSGNAWARRFLAEVFPLPASPRRFGQETYLMDAAPLCGLIKTIDVAVAGYRVHGNSMSDTKRQIVLDVIVAVVEGYLLRAGHLARLAHKQGAAVDIDDWISQSWRILTLQDFRARLTGAPAARPGLVRHIASARAVSGGLHKKLTVALLIVAFRLLPIGRAMTFARRFIRPEYM